VWEVTPRPWGNEKNLGKGKKQETSGRLGSTRGPRVAQETEKLEQKIPRPKTPQRSPGNEGTQKDPGESQRQSALATGRKKSLLGSRSGVPWLSKILGVGGGAK